LIIFLFCADNKGMDNEKTLAMKYQTLQPILNERSRRLWAGTEALAWGRGGIAVVGRVTGLSRNTIVHGIEDAQQKNGLDTARIRQAGGGRKRKTAVDTTLTGALERLVEPDSRGDPQSPLRWTCKSTRRLARELTDQGYAVSHRLVAELLHELGYSLQSNRKTKEGAAHPDRNAQFEHINHKVTGWIRRGQPAVSVDTKKKELVGDFKNNGQQWRPKGNPETVQVHDFPDPQLGKAIPYGVYDLARNAGWVSVGIDHDTAAFAVNTIRRWWKATGLAAYPKAKSLLIMADSGGSNGARVRLWKWELYKLACETGLTIHVCHLPPGTSKWNKIEHRLFSFISQNWRGQPLLTHATIVNLIANTRTSTGLKVRCILDRKRYPTSVTVSDEQMAKIRLIPDTFHGNWNYTIRPI
jgi:transposase